MQEQFKYWVDGKEVKTREEYFTTVSSGDYVTYSDGESVFSFPFSYFFGEKENNKLIKREANEHLIDILDLGHIRGDNFSELLKDQNSANKMYQELKDFSSRINDQNDKIISDELLKEPKTEVDGLFSKIRNGSIQAQLYKKKGDNNLYSVEYFKDLEIAKQSFKVSNWDKAVYLDLNSDTILGTDSKLKKEISKFSAEKTEKEENLVFPKDSEIRKRSHFNPETKDCSWTMCGEAECNHCYPTKDDVITNTSRGEKEMISEFNKEKLVKYYTERLFGEKERPETFTVDNEGVSEGVNESQTTEKAYKETEGKLFYELDWSFITQMAERMASNKKDSKYSLWNWKKPMSQKDIEDLKQATLRHLLEVLEGRYEDDGRKFGHLEAISANMMMINYQLKNKIKNN